MLRLLGWLRDISTQTISEFEFVLYIAMYLFVSLLADRRLTIPIGVLATPLFLWVLWSPGVEFLATAIFNGGSLLTLVVVWYGWDGRRR